MMAGRHQVVAVAVALCCLTATNWQALAAQPPPPRAPAGEYVPTDPNLAAGGTPPPPIPPVPPQQQYAAPPSHPQQQGYQQQHQQPPGGYAAPPPPTGQYGYAQDTQQHQQPPPHQAYYGGDHGYAQQPPPSYQQAAPAYQQQQAYQPPPAYQQPPYQPPPPQQYGQPPPPPPQQHSQPPPSQQQQYYHPPPPPPQQQQQPPQGYQAPPPPQQQGSKPQAPAQQQQQQQQNGRGAEQQGKRQQQQPTQQRQQPAKAERQDAAPKKEKKQKQQKQKQQKQVDEQLPYMNPEPAAADEMAPEYQPRRAEEGGIADDDHQTVTLMEEWEKHMQNFIPEMLVTFSLGARSDEYFYEAIETDNVFLRGGFFVGGEEGDSAVDFSITDPDGDVIYKRSRSEGLFYFTAKKKGTYSFILSNHRWMESKTVTFAIGRGVETALLPRHLNNAEDMAEQLERQLKDIQAESSYLWIRQRSLNDAAQGFLQRLSWLSGIEFLMLIGTAAFHARYIVGLVSDKRIL